MNYEEKTNTYGSSDVISSSGFYTANNEYSEILSDNSSLIKRVNQMLADDKSSIRIIREINNDKLSTKLCKALALKELYQK